MKSSLSFICVLLLAANGDAQLSCSDELTLFGLPGASASSDLVVRDSRWFIAGSPSASGSNGSGAVQVFKESPGPNHSWSLQQTLLPPAGWDGLGFGLDLASSGDTLVIGTWDLSQAGSVFVFEKGMGVNWFYQAQITDPDWSGFRGFGRVLSLDGDLLAVGAPYGVRGEVHIYGRDVGGAQSWGQLATLVASDTIAGDDFGTAVALSGDTLIVSGQVADRPTVYLFQHDPGQPDVWNEVAKTIYPRPHSRFGITVDLDGDRAAVGAPGSAQSTLLGSVFVLERDAGGPNSWGIVREVPSPDGVYAFGFRVDLDGDDLTIGVGAGHHDGQQNEYSMAFLHAKDEGGAGAWGEEGRLLGTGSDTFGTKRPLQRDGDTVVFGILQEDLDAEYSVFDLNTLDSTPYCIATANSFDATGAVISACGDVRVSRNDLELVCDSVPQQTGLFFYGANQGLLPFGDGFRCIAAPIYRLPVQLAQNHQLRHRVDLEAPPSVQATITGGSTWNFQAWYRDPQAGGSGFNLSRGLTITFLP